MPINGHEIARAFRVWLNFLAEPPHTVLDLGRSSASRTAPHFTEYLSARDNPARIARQTGEQIIFKLCQLDGLPAQTDRVGL